MAPPKRRQFDAIPATAENLFVPEEYDTVATLTKTRPALPKVKDSSWEELGVPPNARPTDITKRFSSKVLPSAPTAKASSSSSSSRSKSRGGGGGGGGSHTPRKRTRSRSRSRSPVANKQPFQQQSSDGRGWSSNKGGYSGKGRGGNNSNSSWKPRGGGRGGSRGGRGRGRNNYFKKR